MEAQVPHVFLIHRTEDKPEALKLAEALMAVGIEVWFDSWEIAGGDVVVLKMEDGLRRAHGALVFVTAHGVERWAGEEYAAMLTRVQESRGDPRPFVIPVVHGPEPALPLFLSTRMRHRSDDVEGICDSIYKHLGIPTGDRPPLGVPRRKEQPLEILLELERQGDDILARWREHGGRARLPVAEAARLRGELRARGVTRDARAPGHAAAEALDAIGRRLAAVFVGPLRDAIAEVVAAAQAERELVVRLRAADPALLALPWEAAILPGQRFALGVAPRTTVIRDIEPTHAPLVRGIDGPLRLLVAVAAPDEDIDTARELGVFLDSIERVHLGRARIVFIDEGRGTLAGIRDALRREPFHVLHIAAHGSPDGLLFETEDGRPDAIASEALVDALTGAPHPPALVVLAACSTGAPSADVDRLHVAEALIRGGIPQVIAMQGPVSDGYAIELARHFYAELARLNAPSPARALARARSFVEAERLDRAREGLFFAASDPEYATPTFFAAATIGEATFFDSTRHWAPAEAPPELAPVPELHAREAWLLVGRRRQRRRLHQEITSGKGAVLIGMGGAGKSSLAASVAERSLRDGWTVAIVVGEFTIAGLARAIVEQTRGQPRARLSEAGRDRIAALARSGREEEALLGDIQALVRGEPLLLVLDNFEDNLELGEGRVPAAFSSGGAWEARSRAGLSQAVRQIVGAAKWGAVVVTCRYGVAELRDALPRIEIGELSPAAAQQLVLRLEGLRDLPAATRRSLLTDLGGHPRVLEFADALIRSDRWFAAFDDVRMRIRELAERRREALSHELDEAMTPAEVASLARRLAAADVLLDELLATLSEDERRFLAAVAVFRRPVPRDALERVAVAVGLFAQDMRSHREALRRRALLDDAGGGSWIVHRWTAVEVHVRLGNPGEAHRAAAQWWRGAAASWDDHLEVVEHLLAAGDHNEANDYAEAMRRTAVDRGESLAALMLCARMLGALPEGRLQALWLVADVRLRASLGDVGGAQLQARRAVETLSALSEVDRGGTRAQRDLSVALNEQGAIEVAVGNLAAARVLFQRDLAIAEALAEAAPHSAHAQHDLSVSLERLGDVEVHAGNLAAARDFFQRSSDIREALAKAAPDSTHAQRDFSISLERLGEIEVQAGNLAAARDLFQRDLAIAAALANADPHSAQALRDLSLPLERLGDVEVQAGNLAAARDLFQRTLSIHKALAKADPHSAQAQRDLSISLEKLGDVEVLAGNLAAARDHFQLTLSVREAVAKADPHSAQAQRDLSISLNKLGDVEVHAGNLSTARDLFQRDLAIAEALAKANPHSAQAQRDLSISLSKLGDVEVHAGNLAVARDPFQRSFDILEARAKTDLHSAQAQLDLANSLERMANVDEARRIDWLTRAVAIRGECQRSNPTSAITARELATGLYQLGRAHLERGAEESAMMLLAKASHIFELLRQRGALESRYIPLADKLAQVFASAK